MADLIFQDEDHQHDQDETDGRRILLISYHGRTATEDVKLQNLVTLMEIVKKTIESSEHNYNGFIIGGDFNFSSEKVQQYIDPIVYDYECHKDRAKLPVIDYFLAAGVTLYGILVKALPSLNQEGTNQEPLPSTSNPSTPKKEPLPSTSNPSTPKKEPPR